MGAKNVKIKDIFINHHKYLGKSKNSLKIYDPPIRNMILSPFSIIFDSINRLLMVNFEEDPIYYRIELQIFLKLDKEYPLVIMYRKDNMVDIYYTNEIVIKNRKEMLTDLLTDTSFNQLEDIEFKFQFDDMGLDAYIFFKDKLEKEIELKIKENTPGRELASILAAIAAVNKKPEYFPIVFLNKFGMVIKKNTEIFVRIHGFLRDTTEMPVRMNGMHIYLSRYSLEPIICNWNNAYSGNITPMVIDSPFYHIKEMNLSIEILNNAGFYEIKKILGMDEINHLISFEFSPAIPNLIALQSGKKIKGKFSCSLDDRQCIFTGEYHIKRIDEIITFNIHPTKGWQPFPGKLWLASYYWTAKIEILNEFDAKIQSYWYRN